MSKAVREKSSSNFWFMNHLVNPLLGLVLRSPLHNLVSGSLLLLTYQGRKSGQAYTLPVHYTRSGQNFYMVVGMAEQKRWWRNLIGGAPVRLVVQGKELPAIAEVIHGNRWGDNLLDGLIAFFRKFPSAAQKSEVHRMPNGNFDPNEVRAAAAQMILVCATVRN